MISVYGGTGFIGGEFCKIFSSDVIQIGREERKPESNEILYFISTTSNYNVKENLHPKMKKKQRTRCSSNSCLIIKL